MLQLLYYLWLTIIWGLQSGENNTVRRKELKKVTDKLPTDGPAYGHPECQAHPENSITSQETQQKVTHWLF